MIVIELSSLYRFISSLNSQKANYKLSISKNRNKIRTHKKKTKQGNVQLTDNNKHSRNAIAPTTVQAKDIHICKYIYKFISNTVNVSLDRKVSL